MDYPRPHLEVLAGKGGPHPLVHGPWLSFLEASAPAFNEFSPVSRPGSRGRRTYHQVRRTLTAARVKDQVAS
jgi:hypothetical protein